MQRFGGRGGRSGGGGGNQADDAPNERNTVAVQGAVLRFSGMEDAEMVRAIDEAMDVDMPNHLSDIGPSGQKDMTQQVVYALGMNEKPTVLSDREFDQYLRDNNIPKSEILSRGVEPIVVDVNGVNIRYSAEQLIDLIKYSRLTYIGGKHGGQAIGAGTYFDMNGGGPTGYGDTVTNAVLKPTARVVDMSSLRTLAQAYEASHPQFAARVGHYGDGDFSNNNISLYALAMGYQVIRGGTYYNVIDRSAMVMRAGNTVY